MDRLKITLLTAFVSALLFAPAAFPQAVSAQAASAQALAAKVEVISGNGQLICPACPYKPNVLFFSPMVVKVTDANGSPIAGKTVTWGVVTSTGLPPFFEITTSTDNNGLAVSRLSQGTIQGGNAVQPFLQSVISATADQASVNFTETLALSDSNNGIVIVLSRFDGPIDTGLKGPAGSTGTVPIQIHVDGRGTPVPGVSVRILSPEVTLAGVVMLDPTKPSASCATGPGADPGSVLTDSNGNATCYPVFGSVAGTGTVSALVGGLDPIEFDQSITTQPLLNPSAFDEYASIQLVVTPVAPSLINVVSGNNQNVNPGQASAPLVVQVTDVTGRIPIGNQTVAWTVLSGAAIVKPVASKTDSLGQAQSIVTFSPNATGPVIVRAALTGIYDGISKDFNLSTTVLILSLAKVSGDLQTTQSGQNFPSQLVVQVIGTNGQPLSNQPIGFAITDGAATVSASALTDDTGQARATVTAGSTPGTVTVRAFIATFSQTFTLTVIPPGPSLLSGGFYNAGGLNRIGALSPCSLVTVIASGLAPNVQGMVFNNNPFGPWATFLASDTVTVGSVAAPIYNVGKVNGTEQLTFQVPCDTALANAVPITISVGGGTATITFPVVAASPGIFETVMSDGVRRGVVVRPDGTFVSLKNPARQGDVVRVFVTGLGTTIPVVSTGALPAPGSDALIDFTRLIVGVDNGGTSVVSARLSPNLIGVYEVAFQVPSDAKTGSDVVLSVAINVPGDVSADGKQVTRFSNGSKLPIQ